MRRLRGKKESIGTLFVCAILILLSGVLISDFKLLAYIILLVCSAWILYVFGGANLLSPITLFYVMYLFFIALGPLAYYIKGIEVSEKHYVLIIFSLVAIIIGYCVSGTISNKRPRISKYLCMNINNSNSTIILCEIIIVVSLLLKIYYLISNSALLFSGSLNSGRIEASSGNGIINYGGNLWSPASCILIELMLNGKKVKKPIWILVGFSLILGMLSGFRTGTVAFMLTVVLMMNKKKKISTICTVIIGIMSLLFLTIYGAIREEGTFIISISESLLYQAYVGNINLGYVLNTFPDKHTFLYGYGYLINIIMLKPGPDLDFTLTLKEMIGLTFSGGGVTPTIIGEFYLNFGMIGTYIGMFFSGVVLCKIEKIYQKLDLYYFPAFLMTQFVIAVRSGFANIEITLLINSVLYMIICFMSWKFRIKVK